MKTYILTGNLDVPARGSVKADTLEEALEKVDRYEFTVYDQHPKYARFDWCGDEGGGAEVVSEVESDRLRVVEEAMNRQQVGRYRLFGEM